MSGGRAILGADRLLCTLSILLGPCFLSFPAQAAWEPGYQLIDFGITLEGGERDVLLDADDFGRPFSGEVLWQTGDGCRLVQQTSPASSGTPEWTPLHDSGLYRGHPAHTHVDSVEQLALMALEGAPCSIGGKDGEFISLSPGTVRSATRPAPSAPLGGTVLLVRPSSFLWPKELTVKAGDRVVWIYADGQKSQHTISSGACDGPRCPESGKLFDSKLTLVKPGDRFEHRFTTPGTYPYHCDTHTAIMQGTIIVLPE